MKQYFSLSEFYEDYKERGNRNHIPLAEIDLLIERLRTEGFSVRELKDSRVIVRTPEELKASRDKRAAKQAEASSKFSKLGASFPKKIAKDFAEACRTLGFTQSEILMAVIESTINKAKSIDKTKNNTTEKRTDY